MVLFSLLLDILLIGVHEQVRDRVFPYAHSQELHGSKVELAARDFAPQRKS